MSNWHFKKIGSFNSEAEVDLWARQNRVSLSDLKTRRGRD